MPTVDTEKREKISIEELVSLPIKWLAIPGRSSNNIAYISNETGNMEIHLLNLDTKEFSQLSNGEYPKTAVGFHKWAPD
ncbi:MAG: hypothetical protein ACTSU3_03630, partial [Candidatus Thorarchaeota archaeon]